MVIDGSDSGGIGVTARVGKVDVDALLQLTNMTKYVVSTKQSASFICR